MAVLACLLISGKWSGLPAAAGAGLMLAFEFFRGSRFLSKTLLTLSGLYLLTWMMRHVITSGYPLYPMTIGAAGWDWAVPQARLKVLMLNELIHGNDAYHSGRDFWQYTVEHVQAIFSNEYRATAIALLAITIVMLRRKLLAMPRELILGLMIGLGLVYYLYLSPDMRFVLGYYAALFGLGFMGLGYLMFRRWGLAVALVLPIVGFVPLVVGNIAGFKFNYATSVFNSYGVRLLYPDSGINMAIHIKNDNLPPGFVDDYWTPGGNRCGDSELPCMAVESRWVQWRAEGLLRKGFKAGPLGVLP
jgi:hypothetical protein